MTVAACIKCGSIKFGALVTCPSCGFIPVLSEDKAKSTILTDHLLSQDEIERFSARIQEGQPVIYPEQVVQQYIAVYESNACSPLPRRRHQIPLPARRVIGVIVIALTLWLIAWLLVKFVQWVL
ncbi:Unannotated [Lentimonas sp. CC19]|nr:Unannotated [Lentimonas sp. CC4]CAA6686911.1 Unannotated [Lentimonas sp. CC6]CAA6690094.1 Unannotated [Lentimonas sp. CC19]CAA6690945.1 Unannotated [Lentimonas sp. CC10]CAA7070704.1 Unannotated [Lentimonas sp. CC11]CAA7169228.1 Unannotated [Lentimonas sp. CC21]CAA7180371.1 Unannotated [Lentimonas sp. CC8]